MERMILLHSLRELAAVPGPLVLAFGMFDGVHLGHQAVLSAASEKAAAAGGSMVVFTFDPHPARVLRPELAPRRLAGPRHQLRLLRRAGVERVLLFPFDVEVAATEAEDFVRLLAGACPELRAICVGRNWRFGRERAGDVELLERVGAELGFEVVAVSPVLVRTEPVSSTRIRHAVRAGDHALARELLGRAYSVYGDVEHGARLARTLGFPTANVRVENEQLPPAGVYAVRVLLADGAVHHGVANLGHRPTVTPSNQELSLEVHLFDFESDLYGQELEVEFLHFLRSERRFSDVEALKRQIAADASAARLQLSAL